jgi:hypothetical protein
MKYRALLVESGPQRMCDVLYGRRLKCVGPLNALGAGKSSNFDVNVVTTEHPSFTPEGIQS